MRINARDLAVFFGQGELFENLLFDLVIAEARRHNIPASKISWDPRTSVPDGGRDIVVSATHLGPFDFIPLSSSIWSAKSGISDLNASRLRAEIESPSRDKLREHLSRGGVYVLCTPHPVDHDLELSLREAFVGPPLDDGTTRYRPEQFVFCPASVILNIVNRYVAIVGNHFPSVAMQYTECVPVGRWSPRDMTGSLSPFVPFTGRAELLSRIRSHLRSNEGPSVLHIGGLSGVGKTRAVYEAIRDQPEFASALYAERYSPKLNEVIVNMKSRASSMVMVIIDETPLEYTSALIAQWSSDPGVRVVSIGPVKRHDRLRYENYLLVPEPETESAVLPVIELAGPGLKREVLLSIAEKASHDLRLALLLVRATLASPDFIDLPLEDGAGVWERICRLYRSATDTVRHFNSTYPLLTVAIDVGHAENDEAEVAALASFFGVAREDLLAVIARAPSIGLGELTPHFFEATPRALAVYLFEHEVFDLISSRLRSLLAMVPDRLRRRIVERCQEIQGTARGRAERVITDFFLGELGDRDIAQLKDPSAARTFKAWAELDPHPAIAWLRQRIEHATSDQIAGLDDRGLNQYGASARRQIVWLCEALASFKDHFADSEAILFRLIATETENGIGNNSTEVWKGLFLPVLAFTETPFTSRANLLVQRLRNATPSTILVIADAFMDALGTHFGTRFSPPSVVGGYLTPAPWTPDSYNHLLVLQTDLALRFLTEVDHLDPATRYAALELSVAHLGVFHRLGHLQRLRQLLGGCDSSLLTKARSEASRLLVFHDKDELVIGSTGAGSLSELLAFESSLSPESLVDRIEDVTSRRSWEVVRRCEWGGESASADPYVALAAEAIAQPQILWKCAGFFASGRGLSVRAFGAACGVRDVDKRLSHIVAEWLSDGVCSDFVLGYIEGSSAQGGGLSRIWSDRLSAVELIFPQHVVEITLAADPTKAGLGRLLKLIGTGRVLPSLLYRLAFATWTAVMDDCGRSQTVVALTSVPDAVRAEGVSTALKLGQVWGNFGHTSYGTDTSSAYQRTLVVTVGAKKDVDAWVDVLASVALTMPSIAIDIATKALCIDRREHAIPSDLLLPVLIQLASAHPADVMESIGSLLLDRQHRRLFGILKFDGLFEAVGLESISNWLCDKDEDTASLIARHLSSPSIQEGVAFVPPLTDWLLSRHGVRGRVFQEFCAGRHAFEVRCGTAEERWGDFKASIEPFRYDSREWVRMWVDYEMRSFEYEQSWDAIHEENIERRG